MKELLAFCLLLGAACAGSIHLDSFQPIIENVNSMETTWKADPDFPTDLTISSFKNLLGALDSDDKLPLKKYEDIDNSTIPEEFDARKQWPECVTISQIADQSRCGSCWAVAAGTTFSDRLCIASKGKINTPLSVEELLSCCGIRCGHGCHGGFAKRAWRYFHEHGIVTGGPYNSSIGCQPYSLPSCEHQTTGELPPCSSLPFFDTPECENKCTNPAYKKPFKRDHYKVKEVYSFDTVEEIQRDILAHGPVEAAFNVYEDFPTYKSGVYQTTSWRKLGGHAVRVIGWGTENGTPYWLIANSWNTHWGDQGLFKILRGKDECGIDSGMVAGIPDI